MAKRIQIVAALVLLALAAPLSAHAAPKQQARTYDLDFTLPTAGKSGCSVCHADPNLVKVSADTTNSIYVNPAIIAGSAHATTPCTGCHMDFAYKTPHENVRNGEGWKEIAKLACKNCHQTEFSDVALGAHSPARKPGEDPKVTAAARLAQGKPAKVPLCGDCHGSHAIMYIDVRKWETSGTAEQVQAARDGRTSLHGTGLQMCGQCHPEESDTYADYYHGAAYRRGAPDAPSCWDCHGAHTMLPASDRNSPVNPSRLEETCGRCHRDPNEDYVKYAQLIHRRADVEKEVPILVFLDSTRLAIQGAIRTVGSWFWGPR